jgi:acyl carrier protein
MAEACLFVTATAVDQPFKLLSLDKQKMSLGKVVASNDNAIEVASSGQINPAIDVKIVHQGSRVLLSDGNIGEVMIQGDSISRGYWQKPHINHAIFDNTVGNKGGYMATGDLGFIKEGHLYISGRCKEMFIINGRNYYPQDIEHSLIEFSEYIASHGAAIFEVALDDHQNELVLVQELSRKGFIQKDHQPLIKQIIAQISQIHQLKLSAVILIRPMTLPKTTSGKIQRIACRTAYLQGQLKTVASWHRPAQSTTCDQITINGQSDEQDIKLWIINWVAQRLNLAATGLCATQHLAQLGLDSIDAMTLTHELSNQLNHQLSVDLAWSYPTIESLSAYLASPHDKAATVTSTPLQGMI